MTMLFLLHCLGAECVWNALFCVKQTCPGKCDKNHECVRCHFKPRDDPCYLNCTNIEMVDRVEGMSFYLI